jgi:uncharacterized protein YcbK (DUF882 family)
MSDDRGMKDYFRSSRRRFVANALAGTLACTVGLPFARRADASNARETGERWLELYNTHTRESLAVAFERAGQIVAASLGDLARVLRDHRSGDAHPIDVRLYRQLANLAHAAGVEPRFEIISGYRSPSTNAKLADGSSGVAKRSLHMEGRAIDVRLKGVTCATLRDLALDAGQGGVGYYRRSDFVHLDTGRVRAWAG